MQKKIHCEWNNDMNIFIVMSSNSVYQNPYRPYPVNATQAFIIRPQNDKYHVKESLRLKTIFTLDQQT